MSMDFHFQAHFEPQMFTTTTGGKRVLAHNAVPTIFGPPLPKMPRQQPRQQPRQRPRQQPRKQPRQSLDRA